MADSEQDYAAALAEIRSNVEIRRLMFVVINVLLPGAVMGAADCLAGGHYPPELAWLPRHVLLLTAGLLAAAGAVVCVILTRCHFGLVVNSAKMSAVAHGSVDLRGLNWRGVTTSFVSLSSLATAACLALALATFMPGVVAIVLGAAAGAGMILLLRASHASASGLAGRLAPNWERADVSLELRERHARMSLDDSSADIAVVVTMAAALFTGFWAAMSNLGGVSDALETDVAPAVIRRWGVVVLSGYLVLSMLLSSTMVVRLRKAIGDHSMQLATLRNEPDDPWRFNVLERTFLLFLLVALFTAFALVIFIWSIWTAAAALVLGLASVAAGVTRYMFELRAGRRRHEASATA